MKKASAKSQKKVRRADPRLSSASPIWNIRRMRFSEVLVPLIRGADISMPLTGSLLGTDLSHGWHSTKPWFCVIVFTCRSAACSRNYQPPTCSCAAVGFRGGRRWSVELRTGRRNPSRQGCSETGISFGQLAYGGRGVGALAATPYRKTESSDSGDPSPLRLRRCDWQNSR